MSELLPLETLTREAGIRPCFELAAPNPILGKTVFLRLPLADDWKYETGPAEMRVERNLILRDQMWVTRGEARFLAIHKSGARFEISLRVKPWKSSAGSDSAHARSCEQNPLKAPDERELRASILDRLRLAPRSGSRGRLRIRCHRTERRIEIHWRIAKGSPGEPSVGADLETLLQASQCH
jgi:hypothetical protein